MRPPADVTVHAFFSAASAAVGAIVAAREKRAAMVLVFM